MEKLIREMLVHLGEDPEREGLVKTPQRVAKAMAALTAGYHEDAEAIVRSVKAGDLMMGNDEWGAAWISAHRARLAAAES